MNSKYSVDALNFVKNNLSNLIKDYEKYSYIGCGGSVARGDAQDGSDIDLICIDESIKVYKKEFLHLEFPVECHYIPIEYMKFNFNVFAKVCDVDLFDLQYESNMRGAKHCKMISRSQDEMSTITSSWREMKKIIDAVDLHQKSDNIVISIRDKVAKLNFKSDVASMLSEALNGLSTLDQLIVSLKVKMMTEKNVFSKVYWFDRYIDKMTEQESTIYKESIQINESVFDEAKIFVAKLFDNLSNLYSQIDCEFCRNEMRNCNIYRCIYDYYQDYKKASKNNFKFAEAFSIAKTLEYTLSLYKHLKMPTEEIETLRNSVIINPELVERIISQIKDNVQC